MSDIYETLEEIQKAKESLKEIDYTNKFRHFEHPVAGSLDPCNCHDDDEDLAYRDLTPQEEEAVEWLFRLVETERYER